MINETSMMMRFNFKKFILFSQFLMLNLGDDNVSAVFAYVIVAGSTYRS